MATLKCELCSCTSFVKEDGFFVCQSCGTKFSLEESKKMITSEPASKEENGAHHSSLTTFLELSEKEEKAGNGESAFEYANKALEIDPKCSKAWAAKMFSISHMATFGNLRLKEIVEAGKNAIEFAADEDKTDTEFNVYGFYLLHATNLFELAREKLSDTAQLESSYKTFLVVSPLSANKNCSQADSTLSQLYDNMAMEAVALISFVPEEKIDADQKLALLLLKCAQGYANESNALLKRYKIYGTHLTSEAIEIRNRAISGWYKRAVDTFKNNDPSYEAPSCPKVVDPNPSSTGACYVATAVYGSYDCPEVWTLRRYRDNTLAESWYGRAFIKTYYAISPTLVKWFGHTPWFQRVWKNRLDRMVAKLQKNGIENTPYDDKKW